MKKIVLICIISFVGFSGCQSDIPAFEKGNPAAEKKVLIAGVSSSFKDALVNKVIEQLGTEKYYFKGIGLSKLEQTDFTQYDVVLVVCTYSAGRIDGRVKDFFAKDPTHGKLVGLYTVGHEVEESTKPEWAKPEINIDAVTSASDMNKVEEKADQLVELIKKR